MIHVYTDGACTVGANGGWACVSTDESIVLSGGEKNTTNNRMEIMAIFKALEYCYKNKVDDIHIYSDSQYCISTFTQWAYNWEKNNWVKKGGIKNLELIQLTFYLIQAIGKDNVTFHKVKGHSNNVYNDKADKLATIAKKSVLL